MLGGDISLLQVGGWASGWLFSATMVIVIFRMLTSGKLRTGREVEEVRKDRDSRVAEALAWRTAYDQMAKLTEMKDAQIQRLLGIGEVSAHVLASLPRPAEEPSQEDGA